MPNSAKNNNEAKNVALNVGAQFAQSLASEIFKQTIVANAAGVAATLAYLANRKIEDPLLLVSAAGSFLSGVALGLIACLFTYTQTTKVLENMLLAISDGTEMKVGFFYKLMGKLGIWCCWLGVIAFVIGSILAALGLYAPLIQEQ